MSDKIDIQRMRFRSRIWVGGSRAHSLHTLVGGDRKCREIKNAAGKDQKVGNGETHRRLHLHATVNRMASLGNSILIPDGDIPDQ